ncbi:hypothetical protein AAMO2058_000050800 [Amorphochlora amoebiformis]
MSAKVKVWGGKIPVKFSLAKREITAMEEPHSMFVLLPRISYLPLVTKTVRDHFVDYAPAIREDMWFDFDGKPLRWHLPIGVLYDLVKDEVALPWNITVHFTGYPTKELLPCRNLTAVTDHFFHCLKEACFLKYGSSSIIMKMSKGNHQLIEDALVSGEYKKIIEPSKEYTESKSFKSPQSKLPVRVLLGKGFEPALQKIIIQPPLELRDRKGVGYTLETGLQFMLPGVDLTRLQVLVHGIQPPMTASLLWLSGQMCHADQFLYVCLHKKDPKASTLSSNSVT